MFGVQLFRIELPVWSDLRGISLQLYFAKEVELNQPSNQSDMREDNNLMRQLNDMQEQDLTHLLLDCLASEPLRRVIFGTTSFVFDLWSRPWACPDCWVSVEFLRAPSIGRGRVAPPPPRQKFINCKFNAWLDYTVYAPGKPTGIGKLQKTNEALGSSFHQCGWKFDLRLM